MREDIIHACRGRGLVRNETVLENGRPVTHMVCSSCHVQIVDSKQLMPRPSAFVPERQHQDWSRTDQVNA